MYYKNQIGCVLLTCGTVCEPLIEEAWRHPQMHLPENSQVERLSAIPSGGSVNIGIAFVLVDRRIAEVAAT